MSAVLLVAGFVVDAIGEGNDYYNSHPDEPQEGRVLNAVATGVAHASIVTASVAIGAVVGQALIPIPFVGGFIGGVIGGVIGDQLADAAVSPIMNNPNPEAGPDDAPIPDVVPGL